MLGKFVGRLFNHLGYSLERLPRGWSAGRTYWDTAYLQRLGFSPKTLIDVGVAYGSPTRESHSLYDAFPKAYLVLMEPLQEFDPYIEAILAKHPGIHIPAAAGNRAGSRTIGLDPTWIERSSLFLRNAVENSGDIQEQRSIPVTTLDLVVRDHRLEGPFGIKLDVEGSELLVIDGAADTLQDTQFIIAEVAVANRFHEGYSFAEFIARMDSMGFELRDLLDIGRADNSMVTFIDGVFRKRNSSGSIS